VRRALFSILLSAVGPAYAQAPAAAPVIAKPAPVDPAKIGLARGIVLKLVPDGTYRRVMQGVLDQVTGGMTNKFLNMPIRELVAGWGLKQDELAKLNNASIHDIATILDPAFDQRMQITMTVSMTTMADVFSRVEPQLREGMAQAYTHNFTLAQLTEIDRFFNTPTGAAYAARSMTMMNDPAIKSSVEGLMPAIMQAIPDMAKKIEAATASLPKAKKYEDLSDSDRARLAKLLGVDPAELKKTAQPGVTKPEIGATSPSAVEQQRWTPYGQSPPAHVEQWTTQTIVFLPPTPTFPLDFVMNCTTIDEVAAYLNKQGIKFVRGSIIMIPDYFPPQLIEKIRALPAHHPFPLPSNGAVVVQAIKTITQASTGTQQ
jgi:hypothetical protein